MDVPAKKDLVAYQNSDFFHQFIFDYDITNIDFYSQIATVNDDGTETIEADFIIEKDLNSNTITLRLTKSQINTLGIGSFKYDIKQVSEIEVFIIYGSFKISNTFTILPTA